ncbi:MAG TPA: hypothetical protein VKY82_08550 [Flavobacterium sp.]|nr:hypothetical protein [Flavobacterium sp.]
MLQEKKIQKQVSLDSQTIESLKNQAERTGKNLKEYMEFILREQAHEFEITDEYKAMMDEILDQHERGEINYIPWDKAKKQIFKR